MLNHGDHMHFKHKVDSYTGLIEGYKKNVDNPGHGEKWPLNLKIQNFALGASRSSSAMKPEQSAAETSSRKQSNILSHDLAPVNADVTFKIKKVKKKSPVKSRHKTPKIRKI